MSSPAQFQRTSLQLYRDCLRLVKHVAPGHTPKSIALRNMVKSQFALSRNLTDPDQIDAKKADAVRALSNYMLMDSVPKDSKLSSAVSNFHESSVQDARAVQDETKAPPQGDSH